MSRILIGYTSERSIADQQKLWYCPPKVAKHPWKYGKIPVYAFPEEKLSAATKYELVYHRDGKWSKADVNSFDHADALKKELGLTGLNSYIQERQN